MSRSIQGWMSELELDVLTAAARDRRTIVELGSWKGRSTAALAAGCQACGGTVYAVDHWMGSANERPGPHAEAVTRPPFDVYRKFLANMIWLDLLGRVVLPIVSDHVAAAALVREPVDLLFVDGEHTTAAVVADVEAWRPLLAPGALVLFHDAGMVEVQNAIASLGIDATRSPGHSIATWRV